MKKLLLVVSILTFGSMAMAFGCGSCGCPSKCEKKVEVKKDCGCKKSCSCSSCGC